MFLVKLEAFPINMKTLLMAVTKSVLSLLNYVLCVPSCLTCLRAFAFTRLCALRALIFTRLIWYLRALLTGDIKCLIKGNFKTF